MYDNCILYIDDMQQAGRNPIVGAVQVERVTSSANVMRNHDVGPMVLQVSCIVFKFNICNVYRHWMASL